MTELPPITRTHLGQMLALAEIAANPADCERLAALAAAERLLACHGLRLRDLPSLPPAEAKLPELGTWRATCRRCLARRHLLRPWEARFLTDLPGFRRLSVKQRYCLAEIAARELAEAPRNAA